MTGTHSPLFTSVRRRRPSLRRRLLRGVLGVLAVAVVLLLLLAVAAWPYAAATLEGQDLEAVSGREHAPADGVPGSAEGTRNTLIVQRSTGGRATSAGRADDGTDGGDGVPSLIVLLQTTPARGRPLAVSFPVDLKVQPPGEAATRLGAVHAAGGPQLLVRTLEDYAELDVDHYLEIDPARIATGLARATGGVPVCLDEATPATAPVQLAAGCHRLGPADAARYVGPDQGGARDVPGRLERQRRLLTGGLTEATRPSSLLRPWRLKRVLDAAGAGIAVTSHDPGLLGMWRLASGLRGGAEVGLAVRAVPGFLDEQTGYVHALPEGAGTLFQALRQTSAIPDVGTYDPSSVRLEPRQVVVTVLNGTGAVALASDTADMLRSKGFRIRTVDNAPRFGRAGTLVRFAPGHEGRARRVAREFPGAEVEALGQAPEDGAHVVVVLGRDAQRRRQRGAGPDDAGDPGAPTARDADRGGTTRGAEAGR